MKGVRHGSMIQTGFTAKKILWVLPLHRTYRLVYGHKSVKGLSEGCVGGGSGQLTVLCFAGLSLLIAPVGSSDEPC